MAAKLRTPFARRTRRSDLSEHVEDASLYSRGRASDVMVDDGFRTSRAPGPRPSDIIRVNLAYFHPNMSVQRMLLTAFPGLEDGSEPDTEQQALASMAQLVLDEMRNMNAEIERLRDHLSASYSHYDALANQYDRELRDTRAERDEWQAQHGNQQTVLASAFGVLTALHTIINGNESDLDFETLPAKLAEKLGIKWPIPSTEPEATGAVVPGDQEQAPAPDAATVEA